MNDSAAPSDAAPEVNASPVVATLVEHLLGAIHDGSLPPGTRVSDGEIAVRFGVSRTPVREALQKLRDLGVIEASANRFTRVAMVSPLQTRQAMTVWLALYAALVAEVVAEAPDSIYNKMKADHEQFRSLVATENYPLIAQANFAFFGRLLPLSQNPVLLRSLNGVVHVVLLGSLHLPESLDLDKLQRSQAALLDAVQKHDATAARAAIDSLSGIRIPQQ